MNASRTILIVDDDQEMRAGLQTVLREKGFHTLAAEDGQDAKDLIDGEHPDLVILDMMMPRWGGFAVLEHYHNQVGAPPFIMITGSEGEKHRAYAAKVGAADYIRKPFSINRLLEGVEKVLGHAVPAKIEKPSVRFSCGGCGAKIKAPMQMLGQTRTCPGCGRNVVVHAQAPEDEGPKLIVGEG